LLPDLLSALLLSKPTLRTLHRRVKAERRVTLHRFGNVRVKIERNPDRSMAEPFRSDFRMDAAGEQLRRVAVSRIVEPHARQILHTTDEAGELVRQTERLMRLAGHKLNR
jgi:hypothetical protein